MGLLNDLKNHIFNNKKVKNFDPVLWSKYCSWFPDGIEKRSSVLNIPTDIPQEEVFEVLRYIKENHHKFADEIRILNFGPNITEIPEMMFDGWKFEVVDFKKAPKIKINEKAFINTPNLRLLWFNEKPDDNDRVEICKNAFYNSNIPNLLIKTPCTIHMPIINEINRRDDFPILLCHPNFNLSGDSQEKYHPISFQLSTECAEDNNLFVLLKKYNYNYTFGSNINKVSSYFFDERYIKELIKEAYDKKTKTLVLNNELAEKIEDTKLIQTYRAYVDNKFNPYGAMEAFNEIVFDIIRKNNFSLDPDKVIKKLVYSINNTDLPTMCLDGNKTVQEVAIDGEGIGLDKFALMNCGVKKLTGNFASLGYRALCGSRITNLYIPESCKSIEGDIINHQCRVEVAEGATPNFDIYFMSPKYLAPKDNNKIVKEPVKNPVVYINDQHPTYSLQRYSKVHKVEVESLAQSRYVENFKG